VDAVHVRAQLRYQRQQFSAAAAIVREALAQMPDSAELTELESLATLYDQLAAAWAWDGSHDAADGRVPALREPGSSTPCSAARSPIRCTPGSPRWPGGGARVRRAQGLRLGRAGAPHRADPRVTSASLDTASAALAKRR